MYCTFIKIHEYLENNVWALKWGNGRRIYYAYIPEKKILLLLGGNKNGQSNDIKNTIKSLNIIWDTYPVRSVLEDIINR